MCRLGHSDGFASVVCAVWLSCWVWMIGFFETLQQFQAFLRGSEMSCRGVKQRTRRHHYCYQQTKRFNQMSMAYSRSLITKSFPLPSQTPLFASRSPLFLFQSYLCASFSIFMVNGLGSAASCACWFSPCPIVFVPRQLWLTAWAVLVKEEMALWSVFVCREEALYNIILW